MAGGETTQMPNQNSPHVQRLHRYLPFDPSFDQIYEENRHAKDTLELTTRALVYLQTVLEHSPGLVILTGDAGHGKTHLCGRIIKDYLGYSTEESRKALRTSCNGEKLVPAEEHDSGKPLQIYKDFSEFSIPIARGKLIDAISDSSVITIICINEGRLRSVLSDEDSNLGELREQFNKSFQSGLASPDNHIHIVNLNYQSIASFDSPLIEKVLTGEGQSSAGWLDGRSWGICEKCDSHTSCPIYRNMQLLTGEDNETRRERLRELFAAVERLGTVITIREILMTIAFLLTGGLTCKDIHARSAKSKEGWQHEYMFYNTIFSPPQNLGKDKLARIPVLSSLWALDPGNTSSRKVDERLINEEVIFPDGKFELTFNCRVGRDEVSVDARKGIDEIIGNPRSRKERDGEAVFIRNVVRNLRRRDFFDSNGKEQDFESHRLGIDHYKDFRWLLSEDEDMNRRVRIKNSLIRGLHTMQGLRLPGSETALILVDPAFGRTTNHAAIVARKIPSNQIRLLKQSEGWSFTEEQKKFSLPEAVDWLEREVILHVRIGEGEEYAYPLNLLVFDCILRASSGYLPENFYAHDIRKILNFLGLMAETARQGDMAGIDAIVGGKMRTVTLEEGDVIMVSGENS